MNLYQTRLKMSLNCLGSVFGGDRKAWFLPYQRLKVPVVMLLFLLGQASALFARFTPADADLIDQEERLNSEYFNDYLSYKFPVDWDLHWERVATGYRSTYGSLDIRRFYMEEEIRLRKFAPESMGFSFHQTRFETMNEIKFLQEIRLGFPIGSLGHISFLGDGGTLKKWGDLGLALSFGDPFEDAWLDLYYWSVDHYYNTKVEDSKDSYEEQPFTAGFSGHYVFSNGLRIRGRFEYDSPLVLKRETILQRYRYEGRDYFSSVRVPVGSSGWYSEVHSSYKQKSEGVRVSLDQSSWDQGLYDHTKHLFRRQTELGLLFHRGQGQEEILSLGIYGVRRSGYYQQDSVSGQTDESSTGHNKVSPDSERKEWALLGQYRDARDGTVDILWGMHYNRVYWDDNSRLRKGELKFQMAFDVELIDQVRLLINSTWDVDEVYRDRGRRFRPWGGGNLQFQAVF